LKTVKVYYDKQCPFCREYSRYIKLKKSVHLELIDAREALDDINKFRSLGYDINDGMIIYILEEEKILLGAKALKALDKLSKNRGFLRYVHKIVLTTTFEKILYPLIKTIRKITLSLLNKSTDIK